MLSRRDKVVSLTRAAARFNQGLTFIGVDAQRRGNESCFINSGTGKPREPQRETNVEFMTMEIEDKCVVVGGGGRSGCMRVLVFWEGGKGGGFFHGLRSGSQGNVSHRCAFIQVPPVNHKTHISGLVIGRESSVKRGARRGKRVGKMHSLDQNRALCTPDT